jgi:hypothetical protein
MTDTDYPACIQELYQSEVLGEAAFLALVAVARNELDRYHFGTFLQLETETKARLRPFLAKYGLPFEEDPDPAQIEDLLAAYQERPWHEFLAGLQPLVASFVARFREIAQAGPAQDQDILQSMVTHEEAFTIWIDKEMSGAADSLAAAISQLQYPLQAPDPQLGL